MIDMVITDSRDGRCASPGLSGVRRRSRTRRALRPYGAPGPAARRPARRRTRGRGGDAGRQGGRLSPDRVGPHLSSGEASVGARLLVAADGGRSRLREAAGIGTVGWDYEQAGIVATVSHTLPHNGRATQHFLPEGPLASCRSKPRTVRSGASRWSGRLRPRRLVASWLCPGRRSSRPWKAASGTATVRSPSTTSPAPIRCASCCHAGSLLIASRCWAMQPARSIPWPGRGSTSDCATRRLSRRA